MPLYQSATAPGSKANGAGLPLRSGILYPDVMQRILVVDDEAPIRSVIAEALSDEGYEVAEATNGLDALEKVGQFHPNAIVLDLMMPIMDGWTFVERLRADGRRAEIVVISAANALHDSAERLHARGVRAVLAKPFDLMALLGVVERLTGGPAQHA